MVKGKLFKVNIANHITLVSLEYRRAIASSMRGPAGLPRYKAERRF